MHRPSAHRVRLLVGRVLLLGGFFLVWHVLTQTGVLPRFFFGTPVTVLGNAARWFTSGKIYRHLGIALIETVLAFGLGTALGLVVGLWLALAPTASALLEPYIKAANAMPRVILAPMLDSIVTLLEQRLLRWRPAETITETR